MANFAPPLIDFSSLVVMTTSSFRKLIAIIATYTCENFQEIVTGISTSLPIIRSYMYLLNYNPYATSLFK